MIRVIISVVLVSLLSACTPVSVTEYSGKTPELIPEQFFQGKLVAHVVLKDYRGKVIRRFSAYILASWDDGVGTLDESFVFDDAERQKRVWTLTPNGKNRYTGCAGDVVGDADIVVAGNSLFLDYVLRIPYGEGTLDVKIDDRMYLITENLLLNESVLKKFGVEVGTLLLVISRQGDTE